MNVLKCFVFTLMIVWGIDCYGQGKTIKIPTKISEAFVLEFSSPYNQIIIDSDNDAFVDQEVARVLIGNQTKIVNANGKQILPNQIRTGMTVEIKLEQALSFDALIATSIKLKANQVNEPIEIKGFLDKVTEEEAFISGRSVILLPNMIIKGKDDWKNTAFYRFQEVPLGAVVEIEGVRRDDGRNYGLKAEVKPNLLTAVDKKLIQLTRQGLIIPPAGQDGASVKIGERFYKLSQNLEVNQYVNKVGMKVVPRFIRNLSDGDPNKILFRFYVIEDDTVNAMALADGSVFVFTGLLKFVENEAQLAIVLGHEIGHVTNEHTRKSYETAQNRAFWMALAGIATSAVAGQQLGTLVAQLGYGLLTNKYSRDLENDADRIGMFYAYDAGYDVREAEKVWRRMLGGNYSSNRLGTFLYSDHPSLLSRLKNTKRKFIENYPNAVFDESIIGRDKYLEVVGVYFGWIQPKPKPNVIQNNPNSNSVASSSRVPPIKNSDTNTIKRGKASSGGTRFKVEKPSGAGPNPKKKSVGLTRIRKIDFRNFVYPIFEDKNRSTARLKAGKLIIGKDKTYGPNGFQVTKVLYGDINNDGTEDAIVNLLIGNLEPSQFNQIGQARTYIYVLENGQAKLLSHFTEQDLLPLYHRYFPDNSFFAGGGAERVVNGYLHYETISLEGMCCPKWNTTMKLKWNGTRFQLLEQPLRKTWTN